MLYLLLLALIFSQFDIAQARGGGHFSGSHSSRSSGSHRSSSSRTYKSYSAPKHSYNKTSYSRPSRSTKSSYVKSPSRKNYIHSSKIATGIERDKYGKIKRSSSAKNAFKKSHPCPSGGSGGSCKGYVIDHIKALKHGGSDSPSNMQWQTTEQAKVKDKWE